MANAAVKVISILIRGQDLSTFFNSEDLFVRPAEKRKELQLWRFSRNILIILRQLRNIWNNFSEIHKKSVTTVVTQRSASFFTRW